MRVMPPCLQEEDQTSGSYIPTSLSSAPPAGPYIHLFHPRELHTLHLCPSSSPPTCTLLQQFCQHTSERSIGLARLPSHSFIPTVSHSKESPSTTSTHTLLSRLLEKDFNSTTAQSTKHVPRQKTVKNKQNKHPITTLTPPHNSTGCSLFSSFQRWR